METRRQGDKETWRHGDAETRRRGDAGTWRHGDAETSRHGDTEMRNRRGHCRPLSELGRLMKWAGTQGDQEMRANLLVS